MSEPNEVQPPTPEPKPGETLLTKTTPEPTPDPTKPPEKEEEAPKVEAVSAEALKFPEGFSVDEKVRDDFLGIINDQNLSRSELAQRLVDLQARFAKEASERGSQQWAELQEAWTKEVHADPVVGGDKLEPALAGIAKLIDKYSVGPDGKPDKQIAGEVRDMFDLTGAGNHRGMVRFLSAIAKELAVEGSPIPSGGPSGERDLAAVLYPTMQKG